MGIIKKQAILSSIFVYFGVGLGFLNTALLMPNLITSEQIGLLSLLNSFTNIFTGIFALGVPLITIQLFPRFRSQKNHHYGFFTFALMMTVIGVITGTITYYLMQELLISDRNTAKDFAPFFVGFVFLFAFRLASRNFDSIIRMLYNTVIGAFTENFVLKILISLALIVYWLVEGYEFIYLFIAYTVALAIPGLISIGYLIFSGEWKVRPTLFLKSKVATFKEFLTFGSFGLLANISGVIVLEIDRVMISNMLSLSQNGIYTTAFFFGIFLSIPSRGLKRVALVVIADAWKENDKIIIQEINKKSALNQFLFGSYLFLGIWLNVDYVLQFLPEEYGLGKFVILFIGLGKLVEMAMGVNAEIIATSTYYRYNAYFNGALIFFTIVFNYLLIPPFGIVGAAIATALSTILINLLKYILLYKNYKFQVLQLQMIVILIIGAGAWFVVHFIVPEYDNPLLGILITGSTLTLLFWVPSLLLSISSDVNNFITGLYKNFIK